MQDTCPELVEGTAGCPAPASSSFLVPCSLFRVPLLLLFTGYWLPATDYCFCQCPKMPQNSFLSASWPSS